MADLPPCSGSHLELTNPAAGKRGDGRSRMHHNLWIETRAYYGQSKIRAAEAVGNALLKVIWALALKWKLWNLSVASPFITGSV